MSFKEIIEKEKEEEKIFPNIEEELKKIEKKILVVGGTGCGKSSFIQMVTGDLNAKSDFCTGGVTQNFGRFSCTKYGNFYSVLDSVGVFDKNLFFSHFPTIKNLENFLLKLKKKKNQNIKKKKLKFSEGSVKVIKLFIDYVKNQKDVNHFDNLFFNKIVVVISPDVQNKRFDNQTISLLIFIRFFFEEFLSKNNSKNSSENSKEICSSDFLFFVFTHCGEDQLDWITELIHQKDYFGIFSFESKSQNFIFYNKIEIEGKEKKKKIEEKIDENLFKLSFDNRFNSLLFLEAFYGCLSSKKVYNIIKSLDPPTDKGKETLIKEAKKFSEIFKM